MLAAYLVLAVAVRRHDLVDVAAPRQVAHLHRVTSPMITTCESGFVRLRPACRDGMLHRLLKNSPPQAAASESSSPAVASAAEACGISRDDLYEQVFVTPRSECRNERGAGGGVPQSDMFLAFWINSQAFDRVLTCLRAGVDGGERGAGGGVPEADVAVGGATAAGQQPVLMRAPRYRLDRCLRRNGTIHVRMKYR